MIEFIAMLVASYELDPGFAEFKGWKMTMYMHAGTRSWIATPPKWNTSPDYPFP